MGARSKAPKRSPEPSRAEGAQRRQPARSRLLMIYKVSFVLSAVIFALAVGAGTYESISTSSELPGLSDRYIDDVIAEYDNGNYKWAISQFRLASIFDIEPAQIDASLRYLETAARKSADVNNEIYALQRIVERGSMDPQDYFNLAAAYLRRRRDREDLKDSLRMGVSAVNLKPDFAEAHCNMGIAWFELGKPNKAGACFVLALSINPDLAPAQEGLKYIQGSKR
jgi:tetratricopeptide (TPR) repeat protein